MSSPGGLGTNDIGEGDRRRSGIALPKSILLGLH